MSKPTLDDLRKLAEAAKAWRPKPSASCGDVYVVEGSCMNCGSTRCGACLGAKRAAEDVAERVGEALLNCEAFDEDGHPSRDQAACEDATFAIAEAQIASRIESYFGAPGVVAAFARAVREFCS